VSSAEDVPAESFELFFGKRHQCPREIGVEVFHIPGGLELERNRSADGHAQRAVRILPEKRSVDGPGGEAGHRSPAPTHEVKEVDLVAFVESGGDEMLALHKLAVEVRAHHVGLLHVVAHQQARDAESGLDLLPGPIDFDLHLFTPFSSQVALVLLAELLCLKQ
jgi:hypothetical protein